MVALSIPRVAPLFSTDLASALMGVRASHGHTHPAEPRLDPRLLRIGIRSARTGSSCSSVTSGVPSRGAGK